MLMCSSCNAARHHAKGLCKRCYMRGFNQKPERKALRREWIARNRESVLESYKQYNWTRRARPEVSAVVPVPVRGWGYAG